MYLRLLLYALAPQHLTLCARQVVSYVLSILASYAVCQTDLPSCLFNIWYPESLTYILLGVY